MGPYVALVADGVGGAAAGEVASATAAYVVLAARASLEHGVQLDGRRAGMATTLSVVVCDGSRALLGLLGDSRAYLL